MKKKLYLQPEIRVFVVRHASVLAASPTPAPKVICDFDEYDEFGKDCCAKEDDVLF